MDDRPVHIPKSFCALHPNQEVEIYRRDLPHWRQEGATYFVTFRLADALPQSAQSELVFAQKEFTAGLIERKLEGEALREAQEEFSKRYGVLLDQHLDTGAGSCLLRESFNARVVLTALLYFDAQGASAKTGDASHYELIAAVVMPNHCHVLIRPYPGHALEKILQSWKSFTASRINQATERSGKLWQADNFDRIVRDEDHFRRVVKYIRSNPAKAQLEDGAFLLWERNP